MSDNPRIVLSTLRKWLEAVQNQLPPNKWSLLLLCYMSEIPFGHLEQLQDTADLYNKLIKQHHFTPDESFQLLLRRLSFLKEDGKNCIRALADYDLPQSESIPDLSSKLSPSSRLVECIVKTLLELNAMQQNSLLRHLARECLKTNEQNLTFLELFSKLIQGGILGVNKTQPLIDALKHIGTPPDALYHLRDYHEELGLGDIEYCVIDTVTSPEYSTPQPFAGRPGSREQSRKKRVGRPRTPGGESISAHYSCSSADIIVNYGEAPAAHPPQQAESRSDSGTQAFVAARGVIHPPDPPSGSSEADPSLSETASLLTNQSQSGTRWSSSKKAKCGFLIFGIAAVLLIIGSVAPLAGVSQSYSSSYSAYPDSQGVTVSLGTVNTLWYSSVSIEQQYVNTISVDSAPHASIYVVPSSEVKRQECSASLWCTSESIIENTRIAGPLPRPIYLLEGASLNYTLCLNNYSNHAMATAFVFDSNATFHEFIYFFSNGYKSSVLHQDLPIANGTSEYDCNPMLFTSSRDSYYYITTEITFDNSAAPNVDSVCYISAQLKCFNHSGYTDLCPLSEDSAKCDINLLENSTFPWPWIGDYTILAYVEVGPTIATRFAVNVVKSWTRYVLVLPAIGIVFVAAVILVISIPIIVLYRRRHSAG